MLKMIDARKMVQDMDIADLRLMNDAVIAQIHKLQRTLVNAFEIDDIVKWEGHRGETLTGSVIKINPTRIKVKTERGQVWNCSPSLLTKI